MKRLPVLAGIGCLAAVLAAGAVMYVRAHKHQQFLTSLPALPSLEDAAPPLRRALERADAQLRTPGNNLADLIRMSQLYHGNGYLNKAIETYDLLLRLAPENPQVPHLLAFILAGYGRLEVALPLWQQAVSQAPDYLPAQVRMADALFKLSRFEEAQSAYERVLAADPKNPYGLVGLARLAIHEGAYARARGLLIEAAGESDNRIGVDLLVTVFEQLGEDDKAAYLRGQAKAMGSFSDIEDPWLNQLLDACYDPYQLVSGGGFAAFSGDLQRAAVLLERALLLDPGNASAYYSLADVHARRGDVSAAMEAYRQVIARDPMRADAWLKLSELQREAGNVELADQTLREGLVRRPDSPALNLAWGDRLHQQGSLRLAERYVRRSIEERPNEAPAYISLAGIFFEQGRLEEGEAQLLAALEYEPGHPIVLLMMANINITLKQREAAEFWMGEIARQPRVLGQDARRIQQKYEATFDQSD
jgi:tetratricopeptide (TPR) repeat protein